jgi:hypothetical protein
VTLPQRRATSDTISVVTSLLCRDPPEGCHPDGHGDPRPGSPGRTHRDAPLAQPSSGAAGPGPSASRGLATRPDVAECGAPRPDGMWHSGIPSGPGGPLPEQRGRASVVTDVARISDALLRPSRPRITDPFATVCTVDSFQTRLTTDGPSEAAISVRGDARPERVPRFSKRRRKNLQSTAEPPSAAGESARASGMLVRWTIERPATQLPSSGGSTLTSSGGCLPRRGRAPCAPWTEVCGGWRSPACDSSTLTRQTAS